MWAKESFLTWVLDSRTPMRRSGAQHPREWGPHGSAYTDGTSLPGGVGLVDEIGDFGVVWGVGGGGGVIPAAKTRQTKNKTVKNFIFGKKKYGLGQKKKRLKRRRGEDHRGDGLFVISCHSDGDIHGYIGFR